VRQSRAANLVQAHVVHVWKSVRRWGTHDGTVMAETPEIASGADVSGAPTARGGIIMSAAPALKRRAIVSGPSGTGDCPLKPKPGLSGPPRGQSSFLSHQVPPSNLWYRCSTISFASAEYSTKIFQRYEAAAVLPRLKWASISVAIARAECGDRRNVSRVFSAERF